MIHKQNLTSCMKWDKKPPHNPLHCRWLSVKKNYTFRRLYQFLLLELLYHGNNPMAVYQFLLWNNKLVPRPWGAQWRRQMGTFCCWGKFWEQFRNFFCKVMDAFIHANLEKGCTTMGAKKTPYYLSSMYSPADFTLTDLSCYWKGLNNIKEWLDVQNKLIVRRREGSREILLWPFNT